MLIEACKGQAERNKAVKNSALSVLKEDLTVGELIFISSLLSDILVPTKYNLMQELLELVDVDYFDVNSTYSLYDVLMLVEDIEDYVASKVYSCPVVEQIVKYFLATGELVFINGN